MLGKIDQVHRPYAPIRPFRPGFAEETLHSKETLKIAIYVFWYANRVIIDRFVSVTTLI